MENAYLRKYQISTFIVANSSLRMLAGTEPINYTSTLSLSHIKPLHFIKSN